MNFCRVAPSLGALEGTHQEVWGTEEYHWIKHRKEKCVFFGVYDLRDYLALWWHRGGGWILWAGSDIRNLSQGFAFNDGKIYWLSKALKGSLTRWILKQVKRYQNWVENAWEGNLLEKMGVFSDICPSYMGQKEEIGVSYRQNDPCNVYLSASEGRQEEYGWGVVERIASWLPNHVFHLYGASWETRYENVIVHGRVPKEQMNREIRKYQIGLRLNETDGFSEILAKAVLMGQYAIGRIAHPHIPSYENEMDLILKLNKLSKEREPNEAREWYLNNLNRYPWT